MDRDFLLNFTAKDLLGRMDRPFEHASRQALEDWDASISTAKSNIPRHRAIGMLLDLLSQNGVEDLHDLPPKARHMALNLTHQAAKRTGTRWDLKYA